MNILIRPLVVEDAYVSVNWRNNPMIWQLTGSHPNRVVTIDMELEWIKSVLSRKDQKRFAIIVDESYIGNIYITDINNDEGQLHYFIGETSYWGKGIAAQAIKQVILQIGLSRFYCIIKRDNIASINMIKKCGFSLIGSSRNKSLRFEYNILIDGNY